MVGFFYGLKAGLNSARYADESSWRLTGQTVLNRPTGGWCRNKLVNPPRVSTPRRVFCCLGAYQANKPPIHKEHGLQEHW